MKTRDQIRQLKCTIPLLKFSPARRSPFTPKGSLLGLTVAGVALAVHAGPGHFYPYSPFGPVFVIAMENHNFTQPDPTSSPQQIFGNHAAPFINSLLTRGNSNAVQVSYAAAYHNAGAHVHPSEPNYVWAEAGTDFGVHTDADPRDANSNTFFDQSIHFCAQLNAAGIPWRNYQEDVELSSSPTNSASGTDAPTPNPYYGTTQYNYAVKHNPTAFFADTAMQNVYPLAQLFVDLNHNTVGRFNWITPNQYDDAHSTLNGGFTCQGVHYTGNQAAVAQGDNFLSQVIPQIMASPAYQDNGVIIIWWDESEDGDDTNHTVPEIIISPLAKGNAYASSVPMNHSSDIRTLEEVLGLPFLNNPIPADETSVTDGGYNNVATVNDLRDLFVPGVIPAAPSVSVTPGHLLIDPRTHHAFQAVFIRNSGMTPLPAPVFLVLDNLSPNATWINSDGTSAVLAPLGSPYLRVRLGDGDHDGNDFLRPHQTKVAILEFLDPSGDSIDYNTRVLSVVPTP